MNLRAVTERAIEKYSQASEIRAMITAIPVVGSPLDTLLAGRGAGLIYQRQMKLLESLSSEMTNLQLAMNDKVDHEYILSEEFLHLFMKGLENAARVRKIERVTLIAKALAGATTKKWGLARADDSEALIDLVASMSEEEVAAVKSFCRLRTKRTGKSVYHLDETDELSTFLSLGGARLLQETSERVLIRLQAKGLIRPILGNAQYKGHAFTPTGLALDVMELLEATREVETTAYSGGFGQ